MCWLFALARPATKSRKHTMAGTRWTFLILAIAIAIAAGSENAAEGQEDHLAALDQLCLDPLPCYASPYNISVPLVKLI